jgi:hypothetical protein
MYVCNNNVLCVYRKTVYTSHACEAIIIIVRHCQTESQAGKSRGEILMRLAGFFKVFIVYMAGHLRESLINAD